MKEVFNCLCLSLCFLIYPVTCSNILGLTIDLCEEPVVGKPVRLCCKTEGIGMTGIRVQIPSSNQHPMGFVACRNYTYTYYKSSYSSKYSEAVRVDCYTKYDVTVYAFTLTDTLERRYEPWQCETYSNQKVKFIWNSAYRLRFTEYQGSDAALNNSDASLTFDIPSSYNVIYLYRKYTVSPITHWTHTYTYGSTSVVSTKYRIRKSYRKIYVTIHNASRYDVGTYWLSVDMGLYATGKNISKSLVLYDVPIDIEVRPKDVSRHGSKVDATLYCDVTANVVSRNLMTYITNMSHNWLFPETGSTYKVSRIRDEGVRVTGIDCSIYNLAPIGCSVQLFDLNSSNSWYDIKDLCSLPVLEQDLTASQTNNVTTSPSTLSIIMSAISMVMLLVAIGCFLLIKRKYVCKACRDPNPFTRMRRWWRNRRQPDRQQLEEFPSESQVEQVTTEHRTPSRSALIHERRRLEYIIHDQPTARPSTETPVQPTDHAPVQATLHTPFFYRGSGIPAQRPTYQQHIQPNVPNATGGFGHVPFTVSPLDVNAGPGHVLGNGDNTSVENPTNDPYQHSARVELPPVMPPEFSLDRNAQFTAEANLQIETLHQSLKNEAIHIQVTRDGILDDLIRFYTTMDHSDAKNTVYCTFIGEEGKDVGGVTRDVFTTFWQKAIPKYFTGNIALVPKLSLHTYGISTFVTLGRIFAHSTAILKAIPVQICRSTLNVVIFGEMEMVKDSEDIIIDDFLLYVDSEDRKVLGKALANFENLDQAEINMLRNIFVNYDMPEIPRKDNFKRNLASIAHNELCIKPKVVCDQMGKGIPDFHRQLFWGQMTILHIDGLYETFRPTSQKVVDKLRCLKWPLGRNTPERETFDNLKRFVTSIPTETLLRFLHFVTGERKIPSTDIKIEFTYVTGVARAPVAHTCSCQMELPKSYTNYEELRRDFLAILNSEEAFVLNQY